MDEAIRQFQEALRLKPDYAEAHYNLGIALVKKGQIDEAIRQYQEAIRLKPDYAEAHNNLGIALGRKGQIDEAIRQFQEAARLKPGLRRGPLQPRPRLGPERPNRRGHPPIPGSPERETRLPRGPQLPGHRLYQQGRTGEALRQFQEALQLKPDYADARKNLDAALATKADSPPPPGAATNP